MNLTIHSMERELSIRKDTSLEDVIRIWYASSSSEKTRIGKVTAFKNWVKFLEGESLLNATAMTAAVYREALVMEKSVNTCKTYMSLLQGLYRKLREYDLIDRNPFDGVERPKLTSSAVNSPLMEDDEVKALLSVLNTCNGVRNRAMLGIALFLGSRRGAIHKLNRGDFVVTHEGAFLHLKEKRGKELEMPVPDKLRKWLEKYLSSTYGSEHTPFFISQRGGRLTENGIWRVMKDMCSRAGLSSDFRFHSLRVTAINKFFSITKDLAETRNFAAHNSVRTTESYLSAERRVNRDHLEGMF